MKHLVNLFNTTRKWSLALGLSAVSGLSLSPGLVGFMALGSIGLSSQVMAQDEALVIYSSRKEPLIKPFLDAFSKETGIKITLYTGKDGALIERIKSEGASTPADILMMADAGNLGYAASQGLFSPMQSPILEKNIPAHLRDPQNLWTGLSIRARTLVYSTERVKPSELSTYEELADPKWQGRLCLRSANTVYNKSLIASQIAHNGEAKTEQMVNGWVKNLAAKPFAKDAEVMSAILANRCDVGIVNTYYFGQEMAKQPEAKIALFWANQDSTGTHINVSGAGVIKHSDQKANAQKLIEWLSRDPAQTLYSEANFEYPANPNFAVSPQIAAWGEFKADTLNLGKVAQLQENAVRLMQKAGLQ
ncbi:extracellular solute-binding protein [Thiomicrorhabdus aquaedulcis]|uniref:extracellular solute-binding protein n=1 Tax=Thiomicrorhabdus aquaedulcis TaxID=2211106 RepID=UPI000FD98434|nr:extracellular solute-binding protein [Thiomicrorhabdus aquaedulcis]